MIEPGRKWLIYSGQSAKELLSSEGQYGTASLVLGFEHGIQNKAKRKGEHSLSEEERFVLAVEALEREVNNGGYEQFFTNASWVFAPIIVRALQRIGCPVTAAITQTAIDALGISELSVETINTVMRKKDPNLDIKLEWCDEAYYTGPEPIADRLFAYIKANRHRITF